MTSSLVRRRLTSWTTLATVSLLLAALLVMRQAARRALLEEHETAATRSAALVQSFFRAELAEYRAIDVTISHLAGELVFAGMNIEFLRPDGSRFATARQPLAAGAPRPPVVVRSRPLDPALAPGWQLQLTTSIADLTAARDRIDRLTLAAAIAAVLLAGAVAWLTIGRALSPVATMATAADSLQAVGAGRLPIVDPNDEFGRLGRAFNDLLDRLDGALTHQRRFLADAAHELRTPVARLLASTESRLADAPSREDRATLVLMDTELRRTASVIDALLYLARADADALPVVRERLFLDDVVADVVARAEQAARARNITIDMTALGEAAMSGDPRLLARLVDALMDNAIRYTPAGGRIAVSTQADADHVQLRVEDSGIGVPAAEREAVFARFGRGREARQVAPEGTGLGLAIAHSIATAHRGSIEVHDSSLGGAAFTVLFPG